MTISEFKAWLDGFSASFKDGAPDAEQWKRIKQKLDMLAVVSGAASINDYRSRWLPSLENVMWAKSIR